MEIGGDVILNHPQDLFRRRSGDQVNLIDNEIVDPRSLGKRGLPINESEQQDHTGGERGCERRRSTERR